MTLALPALLASGGFTPGLQLDPYVALILAVFLVFLNGFFVAAEFAIVKVRPTQIENNDTPSGRVARHMVERLDAYLSATQLGITLASLGLGWIGEPAVAWILEPAFRLFGAPQAVVHTLSFAIAFTIVSMAHIVLGELAPKSVAIRKPEPTTLWIALPLWLFYKVTYPAIWLLNKMANGILSLVGIPPVEESELAHSEEEIRLLLASSQKTQLPEDQRELLDNVFELSHRNTRQVMVPRAEVVYLDLQDDLENNLKRARESGHTRFPLCDGDLDSLEGLIHIKDLFRASEEPTRLADYKRQTFFVPETLPLERLLGRMRREHIHMAGVIDEYGGVSGIVTLENVIEEIVGEIQDEFDSEPPEIVRLEDHRFQVMGSTLIEDLENELDVGLGDAREEDTIAGVALSELGRTAEKGDVVRVGPVELEVLETDVNRIVKLEVTIEPDEKVENG